MANGASVTGLARSAADVLEAGGFGTVASANAAPLATTVVYLRPGFEELAAEAAIELDIPVGAVDDIGEVGELEPAGEYDIVIVLGADRSP